MLSLRDRWLGGLVGGLVLCGLFWRLELGVLRSELLRVGAARFEVLRKRMPDGRMVLEALVPSTVAVIRDKDAYYMCGKSRVQAPPRDSREKGVKGVNLPFPDYR